MLSSSKGDANRSGSTVQMKSPTMIRAEEFQLSLSNGQPSFMKSCVRSHVASCFWMVLPEDTVFHWEFVFTRVAFTRVIGYIFTLHSKCHFLCRVFLGLSARYIYLARTLKLFLKMNILKSFQLNILQTRQVWVPDGESLFLETNWLKEMCWSSNLLGPADLRWCNQAWFKGNFTFRFS